MIARICNGGVPSTMASEYAEVIASRYNPDSRSMAGNVGVKVLQRPEGMITRFLIILLGEY